MKTQKRRVSQKSSRQGGNHPDKDGDEDGEAETDGKIATHGSVGPVIPLREHKGQQASWEMILISDKRNQLWAGPKSIRGQGKVRTSRVKS